jgi:regulator of sirC expression with transglutaminase-like and TPR domain
LARALSILFVCGIAGDAVGAEERHRFSLLDALLTVEQDHAGLCGSILSGDATRERLGLLAEEARERLVQTPETPGFAVGILNGILFGPEGLHTSQDLQDPCNLFLSSVLARKQGYCVGVAAVYLAVAEELDLPIHAISTPTHVFLRYDDGKTRINIETFNGGAPIADDQYIAQHLIAPESVRKGVFLQALSSDRFLAQIHNNLGVIYSVRREFEKAKAEYEAARALDPELPATWYNRGKDQMEQHQLKEAVRSFSKAIHLHPNDTWALNNRAMAYRDLGNPAKARRDLEEALRIDPGFEQARINLGPLTTGP